MNAGRWSGMIAGGRRRRLKRGLVASAARVIIVYGESIGKPGEEKQNALSRARPGAQSDPGADSAAGGRDSQRPPAAGRSPADRAGALARHRRPPQRGAGGGGGG